MRICDLTTGEGRLTRATKRLKEQWAEAKSHWNDAMSEKFEETYLRPLGPEVQLTVAAIHRLAELLEDAEKECEDDERVDV